MALSAAAQWLNTVFAGFDLNITIAIHSLYDIAGGFFTPFFEFVSFLAKGGIPLIILSLVLIYFPKSRKYGTAMLISVALGALITNCCLKIWIARPRPYLDTGSVYYQFWQLVGMNTESDKCFPSGHTTAAFATMTALFLKGDKRYSWTAYIFGILMGIARIYLCVHYATDVLGGVIVGLIAGNVGTLVICSYVPAAWYELDFNSLIARKPAYQPKHTLVLNEKEDEEASELDTDAD